jgi:colanic acid biosynthesis glycosyl transferase WcaI
VTASLRILILSQYYRPEPIPKPSDLAESLAARGHEVNVLTGWPHYPSGHLYQGYRLQLWKREAHDGVRVTRTFEWPYHGRSVAGRLCNYGSFALSAATLHWLTPRMDVIYVWHPPLSIGLASWLISLQRRVPFVYDVQDIWPEEAVASGVLSKGVLTSAMAIVERFVYQRASHVIAVTEAARANIVSKGVVADRVSVMPHWIDLRPFDIDQEAARAATRTQFGWGDEFVILFAGNIGIVQGLATAIRAAALVPPGLRVRLVLVGDGADKEGLIQMVAQAGLQARVSFVPRVPPSEIPYLYAGSDALLLHLQRSPVFDWTIPTKTLAYLAAGRPILAASSGATAELVARLGAGAVVTPEDPVAMAEAMVQMASWSDEHRRTVGQRGRTYAAHSLDREKVVPNYERLLSSVAKSKGSVPRA